jgi:hypothetical protein
MNIALEDEFITGLQVLAMIHGGELDISCDNCNNNCDEVSEHPLVVTEIGEFYSCPLKWLTPQVYNWYEEYSYLEIYPATAPSFNDVNIRYWEAVKVYKNTLNSIERRRINNKPSAVDNEKRTSTSLSKLKNEFRKKKK